MKTTSENNELRLYNDLAWLWPVISPPDEYLEETGTFSKMIKEHCKIESKTLLHLGCGGGHHDYGFKQHFEVTGLDISDSMLKLAAKLNPEVTYHKDDMRTARLDKTFDAVTTIDSINYMLSEKELREVFQTAFTHLNPGGVFLTLVEYYTGQFTQHSVTSSVHVHDGIEVTCIENDYDPDPRDTTFETTYIYLIRRKGELEILTDRHLSGIFKLETWRKLLQKMGFQVIEVEFKPPAGAQKEYYPIFICNKPLR